MKKVGLFIMLISILVSCTKIDVIPKIIPTLKEVIPAKKSEIPSSKQIITLLGPDGKDASDWSYKNFIIPAGKKIDSVYAFFERPGYPESELDFQFDYCQGTHVYDATRQIEAWDYTKKLTPSYKVWIDVRSKNFKDVGVVNISAPCNAGVKWDSVYVAISNL